MDTTEFEKTSLPQTFCTDFGGDIDLQLLA